MKQDLAACGAAVKDFLFTSGNQHGRLMDPARNLSGLAVTEIWGADPIHPKKEVYALLADGTVEVETACGSGPSRRRPAASSSPRSPARNEVQRRGHQRTGRTPAQGRELQPREGTRQLPQRKRCWLERTRRWRQWKRRVVRRQHGRPAEGPLELPLLRAGLVGQPLLTNL